MQFGESNSSSFSRANFDLAAFSRDVGGAGGEGLEGVAVTQATSGIGSVGGGADRPLSGGPGSARTDEEILNEIRGFVVATFARGRGQGIDAGTRVLSSGVVGPGGMRQLVRFLESRFHVRIEAEERVEGNFDSLAAMTALVSRKLS